MKKIIFVVISFLLPSFGFALGDQTKQIIPPWIAFSVYWDGHHTYCSNGAYSWTGNTADLWKVDNNIPGFDITFGRNSLGQNIWVATTQSDVQYSSDGHNWANVTFADGQYHKLDRIAYGYDSNNQGEWVGIDYLERAVLYSKDGQQWYNSDFHSDKHLSGIAYGNHQWMVVGEDGVIYISADAKKDWTLHSVPDQYLYTVAYGLIENKPGWIMRGFDHAFSSMDNGATWEMDHFNYVFTRERWQSIKYANGKWVAIKPAMASSTDGRNWKYFPGGYCPMMGAAHGKDSNGEGIWVAFWNDAVYTMKDTESDWTETAFRRPPPGDSSLIGVGSNEVPPL